MVPFFTNRPRQATPRFYGPQFHYGGDWVQSGEGRRFMVPFFTKHVVARSVDLRFTIYDLPVEVQSRTEALASRLPLSGAP
jgi:hypothetical protein